MHLSNKAAKITFALTAVVMLSVSYVLYQQVKSLLVLQDQLNESSLVKLKVQETLSSLKDAETAHRGFLLTKDSMFLLPYQGAYERSQNHVRELKNLTRGKQEEMDVNSLETLVNLRFNTFNQAVEHYNNPLINDETRKMHLLRSQALMDSIATHARNIEISEDSLVMSRQAARQKYNFLTPMFAVLLMFIALGVLVFSYAKIIEQLNRMRGFYERLKKMNTQLKKKNHQLEMINKELDSFTYIASHDLKEPLRKILTYVDMIEKNPSTRHTEDETHYFRRIKSSALRMQNLLRDLLLYSQVNMSEKSFEPVDLNKIVHDVTSNLQEELQENDVDIKTSELPTVKGLPFQIRQLFENLISNSIKYRQLNRPPAIRIESTIIHRKDIRENFHKDSNMYYRLHFSDNGSGFEQTYAEKVFRLFQRLHPGNGKPGTGIGLTICKKIVDNHNGFIKAVSEVNKGTTFEIYLPAHQ